MTTNLRLYDLNNIANYAISSGANHIDAMNGFAGGAAGIMIWEGAMQAGKGGTWLWKNRGNYSEAWENFKNARQTRILNEKALKGSNIFETIRNRQGNLQLRNLAPKFTEVKPMDYSEFSKLSPKAQLKVNNKVIKSSYYKEVRELIAKAEGAKGKELKAYLKQIDEAIAKANLKVKNAEAAGIIKPATLRGKAWSGVKKYTGYSKLSQKAAEKAATSTTFRRVAKCAKGAKGNVLFTGIALAAEAPDLIKTYKTCGTRKGNKQLAKTAGIVAAEIGGYALGSAGGAAIGAAIGTAACPIIGTAIGALCGLAVSCLAGWAARKVAGKSELAKHQEEQAEKLAAEAKKDPEKRKELIALAQEKLSKAEPSDEDAEDALKSYKKVLKSIDKSELEESYSEEPFRENISTKKNNTLNKLNALRNLSLSNYSMEYTA